MLVPIFIPVSPEPFIPNPMLSAKVNQIELVKKKDTTTVDVQQAISGAALSIWGNKDSKIKAYQETHGILNIEEID